MEEITLRPTRRAFFIRYTIYLYYVVIGTFMLVFGNLHNPEGSKLGTLLNFEWLTTYLGLFGLWLLLTIIPGIILAFKRRTFHWFFWPALLNLVGWIVSEVFDEKFPDYRAWIDNAPILLFLFVGIVALVIIDFYRMTFKYTITDVSIEIKYGLFNANKHMVLLNHVTNVLLKRSFLERLIGVGHIIPVSSSGIGSGDKGVLGGVTADVGSKVSVGGFMGGISTEKEFVANPKNCIYGVSRPERIFEELRSKL